MKEIAEHRMNKNIDTKTVEGFGDEWSRFDQAKLSDEELQRQFNGYFAVFANPN